MFDEPFAHRVSPVHGLDPRARLIMAAVFAVAVATLRAPCPALAGLTVAVIALLASNPPWMIALRRLAVVNLFIVFLWLTVPLTMPGEPILTLGPVGLSRPGIELAWLVTLKSNAIVIAFLALVASMDSPTIGHALGRLGLPSKLVFLFLFTYRYLHVIADEWQRLRTAARLRGFVPCTGIHTYRTVGHLLAMVLVNSFDRSGRVYQAMLLRGFAGRFVSVRRFRSKPRDMVVTLGWIAALSAVTAMDFFAEIFRV